MSPFPSHFVLSWRCTGSPGYRPSPMRMDKNRAILILIILIISHLGSKFEGKLCSRCIRITQLQLQHFQHSQLFARFAFAAIRSHHRLACNQCGAELPFCNCRNCHHLRQFIRWTWTTARTTRLLWQSAIRGRLKAACFSDTDDIPGNSRVILYCDNHSANRYPLSL